MKNLVTVLCCLTLASAPSFAQDRAKGEAKQGAPAAEKKAPSAAQKKQQDRMRACNAEAGEKKLAGDARKKFMGECLKG